MTQTEAVLQLLRARGPSGVTPLEALETVGSLRLAARISEAKELISDDEEIVTLRQTSGGKTFARYVLRRRPQPKGLEQATIW